MIKRFICILIVFFLFANSQVLAEPARVVLSLKKYFADLEIKNNSKFTIGFYVLPLNSNKPLFSYNEKKLLSPASLTKIITSAAALRFLGGEYHFPTEIFLDNLPKSLGQENEERVDFSEPPTSVGNLYIRGYGDPSLDSKRLEDLAEAIYQYGVRDINNLIVDDTLFIDPPRPTGDRPHQAGISAVALNYNCFATYISPGAIGKKAFVSLTPGAPFKLENRVMTTTLSDQNITVNYTTPDPLIVKNSKELLKNEFAPVAAYGSIGFSSSANTIYHTVYNYAEYFTAIFKYYLQQQGIKIQGKVRKEEIPTSAKLLHTVESKNLNTILQDLNQYSNNFIAGQILFALGQDENGYFKEDLGLARIKSVLEDLGYKEESFQLFDGSGLDKRNKLSAEQITKVLTDVYNDISIQPDFMSSLSRFSATGTLKKRELLDSKYMLTLTKDELKQTKRRSLGVWGKTGTLDGVSSLAGYLQGPSGEKYAFTSIINGEFDFQEAKKIENELVKILIDLPLEFKDNQVIPEQIKKQLGKTKEQNEEVE